MASKRKYVTPEIKADEVYDYLLTKSLFDDACESLFETFQETGSYKYLKNIGLHQIATATEWNTTPYEEVQKKARMHYDKIRQVTSIVEAECDEIVKEKLNGPFRSIIKQEILKFINEKSLLSNEETDREGSSNGENGLKVEVEEGNIEEEISSEQPEEVSSSANDEQYLDDISFGSPSSVHTSDLSSFEDEISISSDDAGSKRMVSLKFAEEELKRCKENNLVQAANNKAIKKETNGKVTNGVKLEVETSDFSSARRIRKPNSKYFSNDVLSPFDINDISPKTNSKVNTPSSNASRKKGRPKKTDHD